MPNDNSIVYMK